MSNDIKEVYSSVSSNTLLVDHTGRVIDRIECNVKYDDHYTVYYRGGGWIGYFKEDVIKIIKNGKMYKVEEIVENKLEFIKSNIIEVDG